MEVTWNEDEFSLSDRKVGDVSGMRDTTERFYGETMRQKRQVA